MSTSKLSLCILAALLSAATVAAQKVIPASAATRSGNRPARFPFTASPSSVFSFMQIVDGMHVANTNATMTSLAFRRSSANVSAYAGRRIPALGVILGHARRKPTTMVHRQTSLNSNDRRIVFSGPFALPSQSPVGGLAPFNIVFPFRAPFVYQRSTGDLYLEMSAYNATGIVNPLYDLDGHVDRFDGDWSTSGTRGQTSRNENYRLEVLDKYQLAPSGIAKIRTFGFKTSYLGFLGIGISKATYQGRPLPMDLTPFGAPGNSLQHSWDAMVPFSVRDTGIFGIHEAAYQLVIPDSAALYGVTGYGQSFVVDPPQNRLGLVFSDLLEMRLLSAAPVSQSIMANNNASYFYMVDRDTMGGPVLRLTGTFN